MLVDDNLRDILVLVRQSSLPTSLLPTLLMMRLLVLVLATAWKTRQRSCDLTRLAGLLTKGLLELLLLLGRNLRLNYEILLDQLAGLLWTLDCDDLMTAGTGDVAVRVDPPPAVEGEEGEERAGGHHHDDDDGQGPHIYWNHLTAGDFV